MRKDFTSLAGSVKSLHSPIPMADERERLAQELRRHGELRRRSLATAEQELVEIASLLPAAFQAGITKAEIQRLTGVSRPTINALLRGARR